MFNPVEKIKNWFFARVLNRHRLLFQFWNGSRLVSADPFVLLRRMLNTNKFDLETDIKVLQIPDPKLITQKIGYIAEGVREIFDVPELDQGGLSELECVNLLMKFSEYLEDVKKNGGSSLISLPASGISQTASSPADVSDMKENSDSISTSLA